MLLPFEADSIPEAIRMASLGKFLTRNPATKAAAEVAGRFSSFRFLLCFFCLLIVLSPWLALF
jgi:hypothetical protein